MTPGPASPTPYEQCHGFFYVPFQLMCKNEGDKARSRVLPTPPPLPQQDSLFISSKFKAGRNEEEGLFEGWGGILKHPEEGINSPKRTRIGISKAACSRRSAVVERGQGEQKWRGHWGEKERTSPQFPLFFFSLTLFFVCAPLFERLRQTTGEVNTFSPLMQSSSWGICTPFSAPR